jgi:hypothetical protein
VLDSSESCNGRPVASRCTTLTRTGTLSATAVVDVVGVGVVGVVGGQRQAVPAVEDLAGHAGQFPVGGEVASDGHAGRRVVGAVTRRRGDRPDHDDGRDRRDGGQVASTRVARGDRRSGRRCRSASGRTDSPLIGRGWETVQYLDTGLYQKCLLLYAPEVPGRPMVRPTPPGPHRSWRKPATTLPQPSTPPRGRSWRKPGRLPQPSKAGAEIKPGRDSPAPGPARNPGWGQAGARASEAAVTRTQVAFIAPLWLSRSVNAGSCRTLTLAPAWAAAVDQPTSLTS